MPTPTDSPTSEQMAIVHDSFNELFQRLTKDPRMNGVTPDIFAVLMLSQVTYTFNVCGVEMRQKLIGQASISDDPAMLMRANLYQAGHKLERPASSTP